METKEKLALLGMTLAFLSSLLFGASYYMKHERVKAVLAIYPALNTQEREFLAREQSVAAKQFNSLDVEKKINYQRLAMIEYLRGLAQLKAIKEAK